MTKYLCTAALFTCLTAAAALADPSAKAVEYAKGLHGQWLTHDTVVGAIRSQNSVSSAYDQSRIAALDAQWRAQVGAADAVLIESVLANPASAILSEGVAASGGIVTEVFVMDARGLNVAASGVTSDYWQGDEAKFQETYPSGPSAVHVSEVEFDESTQSYQVQVSMTVTDPATGEAIGAVTYGMSAENFF